ncbi:WD40/YVTN/BNR-like repeat-containing protein [Micromonospora sp. DT43]|uniref:WD40/YVTN/BNR-like repeat-containing protein n=1 Tax=Micromonospora sp. DT43 TaxID=3393440 RepID=UPI003CEAC092
MIGRRSGRAVVLLLVPLLAGCSIGDVRRNPPTAPSSRATLTAPSPSAAVAEIRRVRVAVPQRYDPPYVEFVDAEHGYALFASCGEPSLDDDCPAWVFATDDGGRSWRELRHPHPEAKNHQLYAAPGVLTLLSEPHGWWTSTDGGTSFTHTPDGPPRQWVGAQGRFQLIEGSGQVGEWDGQRLHPLATQPRVPGMNTVDAGDGLLVVAAGEKDGKPHAAVSFDRGRTWQQTPVPAPEGPVGVLRAVVDRDGTGWLVGERPDRRSFPALWRLGRGWDPIRADGHPPLIQSVVPIGGGLLAVTGSGGTGTGTVGDGRYTDLLWPIGPDRNLSVLTDGTIVAARGDGGILLGVGQVAERRWTEIILENP